MKPGLSANMSPVKPRVLLTPSLIAFTEELRSADVEGLGGGWDIA
jgi:hypothetical protein